MHKLVSIIFLFSVGGVFAQSIENVDFRAEGKTIVVTYDYFHPNPDSLVNIQIQFKNQLGTVIKPMSIEGDIKNVRPGQAKRIVWDVLADGITLSGKYKAEVSIQKYLPINLKYVKIGSQVWAIENLNVDYFRNGDFIPEAITDEEWEAAGKKKQPAWCYYDNDPVNGKKYGKLYNWYAVNDTRGLAPAGWHVPSDAEWTILSTNLGGEDVASNKMKSSFGWLENKNGSNSSFFSGLPGGCRSINDNFSSVGKVGDWWSTSEYNWSCTSSN